MTVRQFTHEEVEHLTRYWCRTLGIHSKDLEAHPQIDDVILLIKFRNEFFKEMNKHQRKSWECFWQWAYKLKRPSRQKHLEKLEKIASEIQNNRLYKQIIRQAQREKIQSLRAQY
jgi:hypothetical protein